jgi:hypothetical protein
VNFRNWRLGLCLLAGSCGNNAGLVKMSTYTQTGVSIDTRATRSFVARDYAGAAGIWGHALEALPVADSDDDINSATFLDRARFRSGKGWAELAHGDTAAGRADLQTAFDELQASQDQFIRAREAQSQAGAQAGQWLAYLGMLGKEGRLGPELSPLAGSIGSLNWVNDATAPATDILGNQPRESDGIRVVILPTVGIPLLVGRLITPSGWCTASLVGNRVALTSNHCVADHQGRPVAPGDMRLAFTSLVYPDSVGVQDILSSRPDHSFYPGENHSLKEFQSDWAVLILDRHPMNRGWFGVAGDLPAQAELPGQNAILGYSGDLNDGRFQQATWQCSGRPVHRLSLFVHKCAEWKGNSGSPVFLAHSDQASPYLFAINSYGSDCSSCGGGGPIAASFLPAVLRARAMTE